MHLITFSGVDGSGKSTQLERLRTKLTAQGKKTAYFHAVAFSLPETLRTKLFGSRTMGTAKAGVKSSSLGIGLRKVVLGIDLWRFRRYVKQLEKAGTEYLLSDRYFYDTLVNIAYLDKTSLDTHFTRFIAKRIPKPTQAFYLRVTPERVMERERAPEQGLQYLKDKAALFDQAAESWHFITLDADRSMDEVTNDIQAHVSK